MKMQPMLTVLFICVGFGPCVTLIQQQAMVSFFTVFFFNGIFLSLRVNVCTDQKNSKISGDAGKIDFAQRFWLGGVLCSKNQLLHFAQIPTYSLEIR